MDGLGAGGEVNIGKQVEFGQTAVGHGPGSGIRARCDQAAHGGKGVDIGQIMLQNGLDGDFVETSLAPQISYGGEGRNPNDTILFHGKQSLGIQVSAVVDGIDAGFGSGLGGAGTVAMGHDGKAFLVGYVDQFPDLMGRETFFGENTKTVEVHEAGDHNFYEISTVLPVGADESGIVTHCFPGQADEAAVVTLFTQGRKRGAVGDAVPNIYYYIILYIIFS